MNITPELKAAALRAQQMEATEKKIYEMLAGRIRDEKKRGILQQVAAQEQGHYDFLKTVTEQDIEPKSSTVFWYNILSRIFGFTFAIRLMERTESEALTVYKQLKESGLAVDHIIQQEEEHEKEALAMIEVKAIEHAGSMVLGMNDALVELSGSLAGLTLALQKTNLIAVIGLIIGIAAAMSMASAEYLSSKEEKKANPVAASIYTGLAYIITVAILVTPYFVIANAFVALVTALGLGLIVILLFNLYIAIIKHESFARKFSEMATISLVVAIINFAIGFVIRRFFGVDV